MDTIRVNPTGELPEPLPIPQAAKVLQELDGYACTPADQGDVERQWPQLKGLFMIDRDGIVRWAYIECARRGPGRHRQAPVRRRDPRRGAQLPQLTAAGGCKTPPRCSYSGRGAARRLYSLRFMAR